MIIKSCGIYDGRNHLSRTGQSKESTRQRTGLKMVDEKPLDGTAPVIDENIEHFQGFINKEEFKDFHKAKDDMLLCNEAISKCDIGKVKALIANEKAGVNFQKCLECIMLLIGDD